MAWLFNPSINWVTSPRNPEAADLDNIARDFRTWGSDVDAAGYNLSNLDVLTVATSATGPLLIGGVGATSTLKLRATSGAGAAGADIIFQVGNNGATEAMRILNSGDAGIGTTTPEARLDVKAWNAIVTRITETKLEGGATNVVEIGDLKGYAGVNSGNTLLVFAHANGGVSTGYLARYLIYNEAGTVEAFNIGLTSKNVGIGTASPKARLHVVGLATYANNAAAAAAGLTAGAFYIVTGSDPAQVAIVT